MRIGIDGRLWNETGVGRYIRNLVRQLTDIDKDNEYVLFVTDPQNFQFSIFNFQSINWKVVKADVRWHSVEEQLKFPSILAKEKLDLVHFPYFSVPIFYKGKFVVTIHDLIPLHFDTGLATTLPLPFYKAKRLGYKLVLRQVVKKASKIIAVSNTTKDEVVKHLKVEPENVVVTYEGVDQQIAKGEGRREKSSKFPAIGSKQYFLYIGNAYPHKNLERFLEALNILISQYPNISLVLVGKEDYFYKRLRKRVKEMNLVDSVIFYGEVTDEELVGLYIQAKALIMPSLMEGFGLPAVEAMANKCLVLASDIPALREVCQESAIYFNPYDIDDIVQKLIAVIKQSNSTVYRTKTKRGLELVNLFSWRRMAEETLKVYKEVAGSSAKR